MEYIYIHDADSLTVYKMPATPELTCKRDRRGNVVSYSFSMVIDVTCANNRLINSHEWEHPVRDYPQQLIDGHYGEPKAKDFFYRHHTPSGKKIEKDEYLILESEYKSKAKKNK